MNKTNMSAILIILFLFISGCIKIENIWKKSCPFECCAHSNEYYDRTCTNSVCKDGKCTNQIKQPVSCEAGWKCKEPNVKAVQDELCSWGYETECSNGCKDGECLPVKNTTNQKSITIPENIMPSKNISSFQNIPYENALLDVFGIDQVEMKPEKYCLSFFDPEQYYFNISKENIYFTVSGTQVYLWVLEPNNERVKIANQGKMLIQTYVPLLEEYFGNYPCNNLSIVSFDDFAGSVPGLIYIGGNQGINQPWLLGHELTHSYFHTNMGPQWLAEGAADSIPEILADESKDILVSEGLTIDWDGSALENDYVYNLPWDLKKFGDFDKPLCELEGNYTASSNAGRYFIIEYLYLKIGKENILNALRLVYEKYRYTTEKIDYNDFCKAVLYFTPQEQKEEIKGYLNNKLCGAC